MESNTRAIRLFFVGSITFQTICLDVIHHFLETFCKFFEILLVKENLVLVIGEMSIGIHPSLTLCDCKVIIIPFSRLDIKEICTLSGSYRFRVNILT
jgi:hypothetical protein